jgi:hypothetical protein
VPHPPLTSGAALWGIRTEKAADRGRRNADEALATGQTHPAAVAELGRVVQQATHVAQLPRHHAAYELFEVTHLTSVLNVRRKKAAFSRSA